MTASERYDDGRPPVSAELAEHVRLDTQRRSLTCAIDGQTGSAANPIVCAEGSYLHVSHVIDPDSALYEVAFAGVAS
jgi:hypothetical protein